MLGITLSLNLGPKKSRAGTVLCWTCGHKITTFPAQSTDCFRSTGQLEFKREADGVPKDANSPRLYPYKVGSARPSLRLCSNMKTMV